MVTVTVEEAAPRNREIVPIESGAEGSSTKPLEQIAGDADVRSTITRRLSQGERLARWAWALERQPAVVLQSIAGTEYGTRPERERKRADDSPLSAASQDPSLHACGLKGDRVGDAVEFFDLPFWQVDCLVCSCHYGHGLHHTANGHGRSSPRYRPAAGAGPHCGGWRLVLWRSLRLPPPGLMLVEPPPAVRLVKGMGIATLAFAGLSTASALWEDPLFVRMTPVRGWEIGLLTGLSLLAGLYVTIRRPACSYRTAGTGGLLGFLGIACPVCNKILLLLFGSQLLLTYFEPIRLYIAAAGVAVMSAALLVEWRRARPFTAAAAVAGEKSASEDVSAAGQGSSLPPFGFATRGKGYVSQVAHTPPLLNAKPSDRCWRRL